MTSLSRALLLALLASLVACTSTSDMSDAARADAVIAQEMDAPILTVDASISDAGPLPSCGRPHATAVSIDPARSERGRALLTTERLVPRGVVPRLAMENLWIVWGTPRLTGPAYWAAFRVRYGFVEAPFANDALPLGIQGTGDGRVTFDCLTCHAGEVAGRTLIGAANTTLDFESLYDDLVRLNELAPMFGFPSEPVPFDLDGFTTAVGVMDAFGLALRLASSSGEVQTHFGGQRAGAWWTVRERDVLYADGIGDASSHRTMMATLLAFGLRRDELAAREDDVESIAHFVRSIEAPCWPFDAPDKASVARGRTHFIRECAGCHGPHEGEVFESRIIPLSTIGTDPLRSARWTEREAAWVNSNFPARETSGGSLGVTSMRDTDGYLAPPLTGIWARAPYLHNGTIPDLASLLDPASRPTRWRRTGSSEADYDAVRVGLRYEIIAASPSPDTREGRQVIDTTREGMRANGHLFGATLSVDEREDLLAYLRGL